MKRDPPNLGPRLVTPAPVGAEAFVFLAVGSTLVAITRVCQRSTTPFLGYTPGWAYSLAVLIQVVDGAMGEEAGNGMRLGTGYREKGKKVEGKGLVKVVARVQNGGGVEGEGRSYGVVR